MPINSEVSVAKVRKLLKTLRVSHERAVRANGNAERHPNTTRGNNAHDVCVGNELKFTSTLHELSELLGV